METATDSNPDANAALINSFCEITSSSKQEALFFLESHNFDLDAAVSTFLDHAPTTATTINNSNSNSNPAVHHTLNDAVVTTTNAVSSSPSPSLSPDFLPSHSPSPSASPSRSRSSSPTPSRAPYQLRSRRTLGKDLKKPSGSRHTRIRTFADLNRDDDDDDHDDDDDNANSDEPQEYYAGGEKSGMLVQDPTKGNSVDAIFDQARESAVEIPAENPQQSRSFTGTARLLSGETVPSAPQPIESVTHTITFWRNGFSVNDGPLRGLNDPQNAPFLESIKKSECPKELEPADRRTSVHVNLKRRDENYPEPAKPRDLPFRGVGRTIGSSSSSNEAGGEPTQTIDGAHLNAAPVPAMGLVVDESKPLTSIQLRLSDGTRMVSRFNRHHTIRDVRAFIDASRPGGARSYQLQIMGFPPKQLTDWDETIEQAGIANSVVIQKL
ncbi:hypothetical protein RIF29_17672 [Crotalaria pallida]|uniref:Uncharacterized protein n=1 Tax=Crotalaria pallida TaxID=3830 RepID=A0AAN9FJS4_CROPI